MSKDKYQKLGEAAFNRVERLNSELLSLTYGSLVAQLLKDIGDIEGVNTKLEQMGYNIGVRLVEDFLARSGVKTCTDFNDTANVIAKVAFRMFLGVTGEVAYWNAAGTACSIILQENPLAHFVELPPALENLSFSNIICGAIRGALEQLHMSVTCEMVEDMLNGSDYYEIKLEFKKVIKDQFVDDEEG